jgi:hypothetical protein
MKPFIAAVLLLVGLWLASVCYGQGSVTIEDFSGGLNVNMNPSLVAKNQGQICHNGILDDPIGSFRVRPGVRAAWTDILSWEGGDNRHLKILSLYGSRFDDGKPYLFRVERRRDSATADIYVSAPYGYAPSKKVLGRVYPERGSWLTWNGVQYYFDRHNDPYMLTRVVDSFEVQDLVLPGPGQLKVTAYAASGNLNGTYIWGLVCRVPGLTGTWSKRSSTLSRPITLRNEQAILSHFTPIIGDSTAATPTIDTFQIVRTRKDRLDFDVDSLFRVGIVVCSASVVPQYQWIDNVSDGVLADSNYWRTIKDPTGYGDLALSYPFATGGLTGIKLAQWYWSQDTIVYERGKNYSAAAGSPTVQLHNSFDDTLTTINDSVGGTAAYPHIYDGSWYQVYHVCYLDTSTGRMSDTGVGLVTGGRDSMYVRKYFDDRTINLPPSPSKAIARVILRADLFELSYLSEQETRHQPVKFSEQIRHVLDTIYDSTRTTYLDHTRPSKIDSISKIWERMVPPLTTLKGGVVHEGRLYVFDDNRLYCSESDTASRFGFFNEVELGLDDGEKILGVTSNEGYLAVLKTG